MEYGGQKGDISLDLTPRLRQNGCHCASAGIPLWLNAAYSCWGSNQSTPLLAGSKGIFIDTLALTLAQALCSQPVVLGFSWACQLFSLPKHYRMTWSTHKFVDTTYSTPGTRCTILMRGQVNGREKLFNMCFWLSRLIKLQAHAEILKISYSQVGYEKCYSKL